MSTCAGASVLPYSCGPDGKLYLLLAQDADGRKWSDFGGGLLFCGETEASCAQRELKEESHDLIRVANLANQPKFRFRFCDTKGRVRHYTTFLVEVPYNSGIQANFKRQRAKVKRTIWKPKIREALLEKYRVDYLLTGEPPEGYRTFFKQRIKFLDPYISQVKRAIEQGEVLPFFGLVETFDFRKWNVHGSHQLEIHVLNW